MCGIAGVLWARPGTAAAEGLVTRMLARQAHRGPDDQGVATLRDRDGREVGAIGNVRLAILDPSPDGHQPMVDPVTGNVLVFNGELYNHEDVRRELEDGHPWQSRSDTETLLRAYRAWGPACLDRLRGMFAVALWDSARQELWCARDRLGIKPFYCWAGPEAFVFASEVGPLLAAGLTPRRVDATGLASYVRFGSVAEPFTLLADVRSLPAGDWARVAAGRIVERRAYWRPEVPADRSPRASEEDVGRELERAVKEHLVSDVPVASLLSGGVDSSAVTALAARAARGRIATFTLGFRERTHDESAVAEAIARHLGTEHRTVLLDPVQVAERVPRAVAALDQPSIDGINTWLIAGAVAEAGFKVVLSGLGGDELFGGYPSFRWVGRAARLSPWARVVPPRLLARLAGGGGRGGRAAALLAPGRDLSSRYEQVRALWSDEELHELGTSHTARLAAWDCAGVDPASAISLLELSGYMRSTLLRDSDVMSMAHSLELRVPLLDHRLVQTCLDARAAAHPWRAAPKAVLRRLAARWVPAALLDQPKRGFALPMDAWMRGPLRRFVDEGLLALRSAGLLPGVTALERRFGAGQLPWARLWQFVVLGHWLTAHSLGQDAACNGAAGGRVA